MVNVAASACSGGQRDAPRAAVVDSAGVHVLTYDLTDVTPPVYRVLGEPDLEIGTLDGPAEYTLSAVQDVAVADDGSLVVADEQLRELRVYDASGAYRTSLGGAGDGPGEFRGPPRIAGLGRDTVFAFERTAGRVTALGFDGEAYGDFTIAGSGGGRPQGVVRLDDGTYLVRTRWIAPPTDDAVLHDFRIDQDSIVVEHLDASGALLDTVAVVPDVTSLRRISQRADGAFSVVQAEPPYSVSAFVGTDGMDVILAHSSVFELRRATADGAVSMLTRILGREDSTPMDEIRAREEAKLREEAAPDEVDPLRRRLYVESLPERLPAFRDVLVSREGDVWVAEMRYDESAGRDWLVFTPAGELRGTVHTPPRTELHAATADYVIGSMLDELDVPYLQRYPLEAPPTAPRR